MLSEQEASQGPPLDLKSSTASFRWRILVDDLVVEALSEHEFAVYNPRFADAFLLNAIDAEILRILNRVPSSAANQQTLVGEVSVALDLPIDHQLSQYVELSLGQMAEIGIVYVEVTN
ncbi:hypothetical protein EC9_25180 [Rosistilla ulvae]|uniref:Uncharacterized protein n=2 Tax=Rosistilla ulvae TaxID=1930277 RepID=A0A517M0B6_9BACT|nr:hypothetical protein EC9_25180 [Rosistilla ulvae]